MRGSCHYQFSVLTDYATEFCTRIQSRVHSSFVVPYPHIMSWGAEGSPGDVKPAGADQELVGVFTGAKKVNKALELLRVLGADVGSLAKEVLRVANATDKGVDARRAETAIDDDRADHLAGGLQEHQAAIGHVRHVLHGGLVVGVLAQIEKFAQTEVGRQPRVIELCVFH